MQHEVCVFLFLIYLWQLDVNSSMGDNFLKLQEMCSFSQNVRIKGYGILNTGATLCVSAHGACPV